MIQYHKNFEFLEPWISSESNKYVEQLSKELNKGHLLFGIELRTVAIRIDQDDVLFSIVNDPGEFVEVHLTWTTNTSKEWPRFKRYTTFEDWVNKKMTTDNLEYQ